MKYITSVQFFENYNRYIHLIVRLEYINYKKGYNNQNDTYTSLLLLLYIETTDKMNVDLKLFWLNTSFGSSMKQS